MIDELGSDARELIERAMAEESVPESRELERIRRGVLASAAAGVTLAASAKASGYFGFGSSLLGGKAILPIVGAFATGSLVGIAAATGSVVLGGGGQTANRSVESGAWAPQGAQHAPATQPVPATAQRTTAGRQTPSVAGSAQVQKPQPLAVAEVPQPARGPVPSPAAKPVPKFTHLDDPRATRAAPEIPAAPTELSAELSLLERVHRELRSGNGSAALALLDAEPPGGQLGTERHAAEVFAACQAGQLERARRAARSFLAQHPHGALAERVRASCGGASAGVE